MRSNRLQLNATKTEVLWCASTRRQGQLPDVPFTVGSDVLKLVRSVRNLGIYLDSDVSMRTEDRCQLFRCIASNQEHTALSEQTSTVVASHVTDHV